MVAENNIVQIISNIEIYFLFYIYIYIYFFSEKVYDIYDMMVV